jgi:hypothetical protein
MWRPSLSQLREIRRAVSEVNDGGGPRRVRLQRVGRPDGLILASSEVSVEVKTTSGRVVRLQPEVPIPFLYAWGYRLARRLGLPLASTLDPEDVSVEIPVPGWVWPG